SADVRVAKVDVAADVLHARSIGPYAPTTQRPREGKLAFGGQPVSKGLVEALVREGHAWTAFELLAAKSDGVDARLATYESIVKGTFPSPAVDSPLGLGPAPVAGLGGPSGLLGVTRTETVSLLVCELFAVGFVAEVGRTGVSGTWATSEEIRASSQGAV